MAGAGLLKFLEISLSRPFSSKTEKPHQKHPSLRVVTISRPRSALILLLVTLVCIDAVLLSTGTVAERERNKRRRTELNASLLSRSRILRDLQKATDDKRETILSAMDAMDEVLNLARQAEGINAAASRFPAATQRMDAARRANLRLPDETSRVIFQAVAGRKDIAELVSVGVPSAELRYLTSLDRALSLLVETHRAYDKINDLLEAGLVSYESLFIVADDFLKRVDTFRSRREAASSFDVATAKLAIDITKFQGDLNAARRDVETLAIKTTDAFAEAQRLGAAAG